MPNNDLFPKITGTASQNLTEIAVPVFVWILVWFGLVLIWLWVSGFAGIE